MRRGAQFVVVVVVVGRIDACVPSSTASDGACVANQRPELLLTVVVYKLSQ